MLIKSGFFACMNVILLVCCPSRSSVVFNLIQFASDYLRAYSKALQLPQEEYQHGNTFGNLRQPSFYLRLGKIGNWLWATLDKLREFSVSYR